MNNNRLIRPLPDTTPANDDELNELAKSLRFMPLQASTLVNTYELRKLGIAFAVHEKGNGHFSLLEILWSADGPLLRIIRPDGSDEIWNLPDAEEVMSTPSNKPAGLTLAPSGGEWPPISICKCGDYVMIEADEDVFDCIMVNEDYETPLPYDINYITSEARGGMCRFLIDLDGTTNSMRPSYQDAIRIANHIAEKGDPETASEESRLRKLRRKFLSRANNVGGLFMKCVAWGPATSDDDKNWEDEVTEDLGDIAAMLRAVDRQT